jgi:hypothetical protein
VPEQLWKEMARILARNGTIIMNVPFYYWVHEAPHDYYRYTEFALRRFVEISGLRLIHLAPIGGAPEIMVDVFAKNILQLPLLGRSLALVTQWLMFGFLQTTIGKNVSNATSRKFPLGYFMIAGKPA